MSVALLIAASLILLVGLGIIYGSYVGIGDRAADMKFVLAKMTRLRIVAWTLQIPLAAVVWCLYSRLGGAASTSTRVWRTLYTVVLTEIVVLGITVVLGQVDFGPVTKLVRWLDSSIAMGIR